MRCSSPRSRFLESLLSILFSSILASSLALQSARVAAEAQIALGILRVHIPIPESRSCALWAGPPWPDSLQRSVSQVLSAIDEQDFLSCSFGGRTGRGAHQGLATLHEEIAPGKSSGLWRWTSGTSPGAQVTSECHVSWSTEWQISVGSINPALTEGSCRVFKGIRHHFEFAD